jgi:uncharacterized protein YjdB
MCSKKFKQAEKGVEEKQQLTINKKTINFHMSKAERKIISLQHVQNKQTLLLCHMQKKIIFMPKA